VYGVHHVQENNRTCGGAGTVTRSQAAERAERQTAVPMDDLVMSGPSTGPLHGVRWHRGLDNKRVSVGDSFVVETYQGRSGSVWSRDPATGQPFWRLRGPQDVYAAPVAAPRTALIVRTDHSHPLFALDARTGRQRWCMKRGGETLVSGDTVVVATSHDLVGIDLATGRRRWRYPHEVSPLHGTAGGLVVGVQNGAMVAVDVANGRERWTAPMASKATVSDGGVYAYTNAGDNSHGVVDAYDLATGSPRWHTDVGVNIGPNDAPPAVAGDLVVVSRGTKEPTGDEGRVEALEASTGGQRWGVDVSFRARVTTAAALGGSVLIPASSSGLFIVDPATGALQQRLYVWADELAFGPGVLYASGIAGLTAFDVG
jgi:outer membrane protein assembly factor BamB